jgi:hypothetical protein
MDSVIHETVLKDIVDLITDIKDDYESARGALKASGGNTYSSIMKGTSDLVLVFPFLCDSTVSMESAAMTSKAIERQCVTMLRLLFSACQISDYSNGREFLAQFHNNIRPDTPGEMDLDDFLTIMDKYTESGDLIVKDRKKYDTIMEQLRLMCNEEPLMESTNNYPLSDYTILERDGSISVLGEAKNGGGNGGGKGGHNNGNGRGSGKPRSGRGNATSVSRFDSDAFERAINYAYGDSFERAEQDFEDAINRSVNRAERDMRRQQKAAAKAAAKQNGGKGNGGGSGNNGGSNANGNNPKNQTNMDRYMQGRRISKVLQGKSNAKVNVTAKADSKDLLDPKDLAQFYKNMADAQSNMILDTDAKKANELQPSLMLVNYTYKNDQGYYCPAQFVCGVKCRLVPVDPMDISDRILVKHQDKNVLFNFIRATTGETAFVKDFLFAIDKAKIDAMSQSRTGSSNKMWKVLERRANLSKYRQYFSKTNDCAMITTLGVSKELAEYIKKENGIDLEKPKVAAQIMEGYNLMGFVIIDEATEVDRFLWDNGERYYETITFNNLEREQSGGEYKKALNLMQKMYR